MVYRGNSEIRPLGNGEREKLGNGATGRWEPGEAGPQGDQGTGRPKGRGTGERGRADRESGIRKGREPFMGRKVASMGEE